jgi:hypothetical protein
MDRMTVPAANLPNTSFFAAALTMPLLRSATLQLFL